VVAADVGEASRPSRPHFPQRQHRRNSFYMAGRPTIGGISPHPSNAVAYLARTRFFRPHRLAASDDFDVGGWPAMFCASSCAFPAWGENQPLFIIFAGQKLAMPHCAPPRPGIRVARFRSTCLEPRAGGRVSGARSRGRGVLKPRSMGRRHSASRKRCTPRRELWGKSFQALGD